MNPTFAKACGWLPILGRLPRIVSAAIPAASIAFGLFFVMNQLIYVEEVDLDEPAPALRLDFHRKPRPVEPEREKRSLPKRVQPPPTPRHNPQSPPRTKGDPRTSITAPTISAPQHLPRIRPTRSGLYAHASRSATPQPVVRVRPTYPRQPAAQGIEGWVLLTFTIDKRGAVERPRVIRAHPPGVFDAAALRALRKWRYKPQVREGKPIKTHGVQVKLSFQLDR